MYVITYILYTWRVARAKCDGDAIRRRLSVQQADQYADWTTALDVYGPFGGLGCL